MYSGESMSVLSEARDKFGIAGELIAYMWRMKMWWAIPMVSVLLLLGILIVMGSTSGVGPFIYTLF